MVAELAKYKSEKDEIDKKIIQIEKRLNSMFDVLGCDEVDVELGCLKRVREADKKKWVIELKMK